MISLKQEKGFLNVIFFTVLFLCMNNSPNYVFSKIGALSILSLFCINTIIFICAIKNYQINKSNIKFVSSCLLIIMVYFIGIANYPNKDSIITIAKISMLMIFCILMSSFDYEKDYYDKMLEFGIVIYLLMFGLEVLYYGSNLHIIQRNTAGMLFVIYIYFSMLLYLKNKSLRFIIYSILFFLFIVSNRARTSVLVTVVFLSVYIFWGIICKNKFIYNLFIIAVFIFIFAFIYFYTYGENIELFAKLNELSKIYFHKNFFSGRNIIWKNLFEYIKIKPLLGYGAGVVSTDLYPDFEGSTHSFYLQVLIQVGWIGMFLWLLFFKIIWNMFWYDKDNEITRISAAFLIGILIQNIFELTFYSNKIAIGIIQWLIIAIGISQTMKKYEVNHTIYKE